MPSEFINFYEFGRIAIEDKTYTSDVILLGKNVKAKWWRERGHNLVKEDLKEILAYEPELLIVGTGAYGMMTVPANLSKELNFEVVSYPTKEAVKKYNQEIKSDKKIAGAFHLTC
ncbi:MAG: Mth938-like domain-containing protein [Candidatus Hodarchaeota archaeon]